MAMLFTRRHIQNPRPVLLFWEPIVMVDTSRYVGVTLDKLIKGLPEAGGAGFSPEQEEWPFLQERRSAVQAVFPSHDGLWVSGSHSTHRCRHTTR